MLQHSKREEECVKRRQPISTISIPLGIDGNEQRSAALKLNFETDTITDYNLQSVQSTQGTVNDDGHEVCKKVHKVQSMTMGMRTCEKQSMTESQVTKTRTM